MFPSPSTGAAENPYSATPSVARTRTLLVNGYERGMRMLPSAIPAAPLASVLHERVNVPRLRLAREHAARCAEQPVHLVEVVDHEVHGGTSRLLRSPSQSAQSAGGERRQRRDARPADRARPPPRGARARRTRARTAARARPSASGRCARRPRGSRRRPPPSARSASRRRHACGRRRRARRPHGGRRRHADVDGLDLRVGKDRLEVDGRLGADDRGDACRPARGCSRRRPSPALARRARRSSGVRGAHETGADDRERDHLSVAGASRR